MIDPLLQAVLDAPEDNLPRLIYADAIEESDPARAEFIRVQVELAVRPDEDKKICPKCLHQRHGNGLPQHLYYCKSSKGDELRAREREILDVPGDWLPGILWPSSECSQWDRGFICRIEVPANWWLMNADALTAMQPIQEVTLTTWPDWFYDGDVIVLHDGRHPQTGPTWYRCKIAKMLQEVGTLATLSGTLAAEWPRIKFTLPPLFAASWTEGRSTPLDDIRAVRDRIIADLVGIPPDLIR